MGVVSRYRRVGVVLENEITQTQLFRISANLVKEECWLLAWRHVFTRCLLRQEMYQTASTYSEQVMESKFGETSEGVGMSIKRLLREHYGVWDNLGARQLEA